MGLFKKSAKESSSCCCGNVDDLILKDGQEEKESICGSGCDCGTGCSEIEPDITKSEGLTIKILGSGCKNCVTLTENVKMALEEMNLQANIVKVTDMAEITGYGIMSTPAMVVNEKVVSYGKVLKLNEVVKILEKVVK